MSFIINPYVFGVAYDPDAQAFFNRVTAAGGTLSNTEKTAVNQLVLDMKSANVWTSMKAVYPMVGSSSAACAQNLKSSSFTGTFTSGWTFSSNGASTIKTSGSYMDTGLLPSSNLSSSNTHISYYNNLAVIGDSNVAMGDNGLSSLWIGLYVVSNLFYSAVACPFTDAPLGSNTAFFLSNKQTASNLKFIKNSTILASRTVGTLSFLGTQNLFLNNFNTSTGFSTGSRCAFASIGDGLTDTQATNFYTAVQAFNTTLSRQV
jgi:hypothetical protein